MRIPSLQSARSVVDLFLKRLAAEELVARAPIEDTIGDVSEEEEKAYEDVVSAINSKGAQYDEIVSDALGRLIRSSIDVTSKSTKTFWEDPEVKNLVEDLPTKIIYWTGKALGRKMSKKLNKALGVYVYKLYKRVEDSGVKTPVLWFEDRNLKPSEILGKFASLLSKETGQKWEPEDVITKYTYTKKERLIYDEDIFRTNVTVKAHTAVNFAVNIMNDLLADETKFSTKLAESVIGGDAAVTWMRPPRGKTQSGIEQTSPEGRRMDSDFEKLMFNAMETKNPITWNYVSVQVEPTSKGSSMAQLTMEFPGYMNNQKFNVEVPGDVGLAMREYRKDWGEKPYTLHVLEYDPKDGFKVRLDDFKGILLRNTKKSIRETGVTAKELEHAIRSIIDEYVDREVRPDVVGDVADVAYKCLGENVLVEGHNIADENGLKNLIDMNENREVQKGKVERGTTLKEFEKKKQELEQKRKQQEEEFGEDVVHIIHEKMDNAKRAAKKIADTIVMHFPAKSPFKTDPKTWTISYAFNNRDGARFLVELAMDSAIMPTTVGAIPFSALLLDIFKSETLLSDAARTRKLFGPLFDKVLPSLKMVLLAEQDEKRPKDQRMSHNDRVTYLKKYFSGNLEVTEEDRASIAKMISSKRADALLDEINRRLKFLVQKAFIDLYNKNDPEIVRVVEETKAPTKRRVTLTDSGDIEKELRTDVSLKKRLDKAKPALKAEMVKNERRATELEDMLLRGEYDAVRKILKKVKIPIDILDLFEDIAKTPPPEGADDEKFLSAVVKIVDEYENTLNREMTSNKDIEKMYRSVPLKQERKKSESAPVVDVQSSIYRLAVNMAYDKMLFTKDQCL